jgi:D-beta-D-heptose 7-phosphate kinase/D-beta-D-heptose 1-phosphate adenosyltransferase
MKKKVANKIINYKSILKKNLILQKKNLNKINILCIGDLIIDKYVYGRIDRISPEAPIPIFLKEKEEYRIGGAGNVAENILALGARTTLITLDDQKKIALKNISNDKKIKHIKFRAANYKLPIKTRYIEKSSQIIRIDDEKEDFKLDKKIKDKIIKSLLKEIKKHNLVILSDYNKGLLDRDLIQKILRISKKANKLVIADPKKLDFGYYCNIDIITPNQKEVEDASGKKNLTEKQLINYSKKTINKNNIKNVLITRSEKGMLLINSKYTKKIHAKTTNVLDVTGAGDTVLATLAVTLSLGLDLYESSKLSNIAGSIVVSKNGTSVVKFNELISILE